MAALALFALAAPRLITAAPLDLLGDAGRPSDAAQDPDANFPGAAFFLADGLLDRPASGAIGNGPVLALDNVQAAPAVSFRGMTALDNYRALNCLTSAIYYEAGNEPEEGQRAVAQVVLNRVRSPLWPHSVCAVVYQGSERTDQRCQFTFSCDGSMTRAGNEHGWLRARRIAAQALAGQVYAPVGLATFYHTLAVRPGWAASKQPVAVVGSHIFYRNAGFHGTHAAFRAGYSGRETLSGPAPRSWSGHSPATDYDIKRGLAAESPAIPTPPQHISGGRAELPSSTIRPEYRNSGRPLI